MRVLVTGGAGFIGSHVVEALLLQGAEVAVVDDLSSGRRENLPAGARFFEQDLRDAEGVAAVFEEVAPTHLCHHAAQASVSASVTDPGRDAQVNLLGGIHALMAAQRVGVKKVVYASSGGAMYGEIAAPERAREDWPWRPKSPYGASKSAFELYVEAWSQLYGIGSVSLRYSNVYGPRQSPHGEAGVVAIFSDRLLRGESVVLYGRDAAGDDGCERDYVHVHDVVAANLLALGTDLQGAYNVATGVAHDTRQVLAAVATALRVTPVVEEAPPRTGDLLRCVLDPSLLRAQGWKPRLSFEEGMALTARSFAPHAC